ncbi:hypothetical protein SUGI_0775440 [Cryptomeria japonica]|nr:hypothetical protein SUGI_0775440 [Cryptomeria japonica]
MGSPKVVAVTSVFALSIMHMLLVQGFECEKVPVEFCAFSVASSGVRCVLENTYISTSSQTSPQYECQV